MKVSDTGTNLQNRFISLFLADFLWLDLELEFVSLVFYGWSIFGGFVLFHPHLKSVKLSISHQPEVSLDFGFYPLCFRFRFLFLIYILQYVSEVPLDFISQILCFRFQILDFDLFFRVQSYILEFTETLVYPQLRPVQLGVNLGKDLPPSLNHRNCGHTQNILRYSRLLDK